MAPATRLACPDLDQVIGFGSTSAIVAGVCVAGLLVTVTLLPEPKGLSLEELTETHLAVRARRHSINRGPTP